MYEKNVNKEMAPYVLYEEINKISNLLHRDTLEGGADTIEINEDLYNGLDSILKQGLSQRYEIAFNKFLEGNIFLIKAKNEIKGLVKLI